MKIIPKKKPLKPIELYLEDIEEIANLMGGVKSLKIEKDNDDIYFDSVKELTEECNINKTDNLRIYPKEGLASWLSIYSSGISTDFLGSNKDSVENFLRQKESDTLTKNVVHLEYRVPRKTNSKNNTSVIIKNNNVQMGKNNHISKNDKSQTTDLNSEKKISILKDILLPIIIPIIVALILWYLWGID